MEDNLKKVIHLTLSLKEIRSDSLTRVLINKKRRFYLLLSSLFYRFCDFIRLLSIPFLLYTMYFAYIIGKNPPWNNLWALFPIFGAVVAIIMVAPMISERVSAHERNPYFSGPYGYFFLSIQGINKLDSSNETLSEISEDAKYLFILLDQDNIKNTEKTIENLLHNLRRNLSNLNHIEFSEYQAKISDIVDKELKLELGEKIHELDTEFDPLNEKFKSLES